MKNNCLIDNVSYANASMLMRMSTITKERKVLLCQTEGFGGHKCIAEQDPIPNAKLAIYSPPLTFGAYS